MTLYAGIDAGQSGTVAVIGDESGRILGRGRAGAADEIGQDAQSTRLRDALRAAYDEAAIAAKIGLLMRAARESSPELAVTRAASTDARRNCRATISCCCTTR